MADADIVQNMIVQLGQSQNERFPRELNVHYADVDERTTSDLWEWTRKFSDLVNYYASSSTTPDGPWTPVFPDTGTSLQKYLERTGAKVPPHLALFLSFLELYRTPQEIANRITGRHLQFYYEEVLRLQKRGPVPDHAHVLLTLKKGAAPIAVGPQNIFTAGKDATGIELLYAPVIETVISAATVDSLRSIYLDRTGHGTVRFAPIANSSDGLGGKLPAEDEPKWRAFGYAELPRAEIGFAVASPVLRMREGQRTVKLIVKLTGVDSTRLNTASLAGAFHVFVTGEKSWIEPDSIVVTLASDGILHLDCTFPPTASPIVDYQQAIHGYAYATEAPVVQVLLTGDTTLVGYLDFASVSVTSASVAVEVDSIASMTLESDAGALDPKKAFQPFGSEATQGSRFMVAYPEATSKKLSEVKLSVQWKDAPSNFGTLYSGYDISGGVSNSSFTASVTFHDAAGTEFDSASVHLFGSNARTPIDLTFTPGGASGHGVADAGSEIRALQAANSTWSKREAKRRTLQTPVRGSNLKRFIAAPTREGFITLTLNRGFYHAEYRAKYVQNVITFTKSKDADATLPALNEPYTPTVQSISLSYKAFSEDVRVSGGTLADFAKEDAQFFHVAPFGPMREHGYERQKFSFLSGTDVRLLPSFPYGGELLIGLGKLVPGDGASLLFQVASGSADPELPQEEILWFVLCDNHWRPLGPDELVLDTTNKLLASGIVKFTIPLEATTENTVLPAGEIWIKAAVPGNVAAVSQLIDVQPNAIEVQLVDQGNDPAHLESALPAKSIAKLKNGLSAVKAVLQPYASFGAKPAERQTAFHTRVAERLRHKNRCVTPWDYERVVLEAFPTVHRVKCIPHAKDGSWMSPGNVLLVLVPDLRNRNAVDPLQPRVDADTQSRILAHVEERAGPQVSVHVKNPTYQKIRLEFKVKFHAGYEFNHYREELHGELIRALSPWAFDAEREISFGGAVYKSVLLNLVEELPYVDYLTDFKMYSFAGDTVDLTDVNVARPLAPDAILVSDSTHTITEAA